MDYYNNVKYHLQKNAIVVVIICILSLFCASFFIGIVQNQHLKSSTYAPHSYSVAYTYLQTDGKWDHTYSKNVLDVLKNRYVMADTIKKLKSQKIIFEKPTPHIGGIDTGYDEYVLLAVLLFGLNVQSTYFLFFLLFGISSILFIAENKNSLFNLSILAIITIGLATAVFSFPSNTQLANVSDPRTIAILSLPATLHLLSFLRKNSDAFNKVSILYLILQSVLLIFVISIRITSIWQFFMVQSFVLYYLFLGIRHQNFKSMLRTIGLSALLCVLLISSNYLRFINIENGNNSISVKQHVFWHNFGIGLALNPTIKGKYGPTRDPINDNFMFDLVIERATKQGVLASILDASGKFRYWERDRQLYERLAKDVVLDIFKQNPTDVIRSFIYDKPVAIIQTLMIHSFPNFFHYLNGDANRFGLPFLMVNLGHIYKHYEPIEVREEKGYYFSIFRFVFIIPVIILALIIPDKSRMKFARMSAISSGGLLFFSLMPLIGIYPTAHTMGTFLVLFGAVLAAVGIVVVWRCEKAINNKIREGSS